MNCRGHGRPRQCWNLHVGLIDIHEGDKIDEAALKDLIRAAVALNLKGKSMPKPRRTSSKRAD